MLNAKYIENLRLQINNATDCRSLVKIFQELQTYLNKILSELNIQVSILSPLLSNPTDLGSVISWINNMIAMLSGPYHKALAMIEQITALQLELVALVEAAMLKLTCSIADFVIPSASTPVFGAAMFGESLLGG